MLLEDASKAATGFKIRWCISSKASKLRLKFCQVQLKINFQTLVKV